MNKKEVDSVEYFKKTGKGLNSFKNMPESYKLILSNMTEHEWLSVFAVMCMYNLKKQEVPELNLRTKGIDEIYAECWELHQRGFLERVIINDVISAKIKSLQGFI